MSQFEIRKSSEIALRWVDIRFNFSKITRTIFRLKEPDNFALHQRFLDTFIDKSSYDYELSLYGKKRCSCCNGLGFVDGDK